MRSCRCRTLILLVYIISVLQPTFAKSHDEILAWEGGPAVYRQWPNGPSAATDVFPIAVWLQDPRHAAEYRSIGVNLFIGLWQGPTSAQLELLRSAGVPVLAAHTADAPALPELSGLRGWIMMDEPDNAQPKPGGGYGACVAPSEIVSRYDRIKAADSTRPVYLNLGQGVIYDKYKGRGSECGGHMEQYAEYIRGADIVSYDVYPVNNNLPLWYTGAGVERLRKWANHKKPVWNWIETTSIGNGPKPTAVQIRSQVWMSIIHGSMGIGYFCHKFSAPADTAAPLHDREVRETLSAINAQIASLAPVLNSAPVANGVTVSSSNAESAIDTLLKREGGKTYVFAVGGRPGGVTTVRFELRDCGNTTAQVLGESRTIRVNGGVFEDQFADYQVHIYELPFDPNL
jgi:hypothetical protein